MNALVLSGGGMFGAYQAGAWQAIASRFQPDLVTGVSIGSLNGYLIACGATPEELTERWLSLDDFARLRFRIGWNPLEGCVDVTRLEKLLKSITSERAPRIPLVVLATELMPPRRREFGPAGITWRHLAASCALLGILPQYRIEGRRHSDGGLLCGLPIAAAASRGASCIVAVNCLPCMPAAVRAALRLLRRVTRENGTRSGSAQVITVAPSHPLGSLKDAAFWTRDNALRWMEQGRRDAEAALAREEWASLPVHRDLDAASA